MPGWQEGMAKSPLAGIPSSQALRYWTENGEAGRSGTDPENLPATEIAGESKMGAVQAGRNPNPGRPRKNRCAAILGG